MLANDLPAATVNNNMTDAYRHYILNRLHDESGRKACHAEKCAQPKGRQIHWVECDNCHAWLHFVCASITAAPETFYCVGCIKRRQKALVSMP